MNNHEMPDNEDEWRQRLTPEQFAVLREAGTEAPFSGEYVDEKRSGTYTCAGCGNELFSSETKYDAGCGWPSFYDLLKEGVVELREDLRYGMRRTEVLCSNCGSHLGHVFDVGSETKTGKWYCMNSVALDLKPEES